MYINNDTGVDVANGWADMDGTVSAGDRAIWDGTKWELIRSNTSNGTLVEVRKADPIEVDAIDDPTRPIVGIRTAVKELTLLLIQVLLVLLLMKKKQQPELAAPML